MPKQQIVLYEHQVLKLNDHKGFTVGHLELLRRFHGEKGTPFFSLIHNGVKFCEYVGVLQIENLTIEVLPKIDKVNGDETTWQKVLIDMLHAVGVFPVKAPTSANLSIKRNSILEMYFALFVNECEYLFHQGLIKKYRKTEGNLTALKGALQFAKQMQHNVVHKERFYTKYTAYDREHTLNCILYKTLCLLQLINRSALLSGRINQLLLSFPELKDIKVSDDTFAQLKYDRKTESYRKAIEIARLLLLNYHPDMVRGQNHILALMFDMNALWEAYIFKQLRKVENKDCQVIAKQKQVFWTPHLGSSKSIIPDILLTVNNITAVIDTKWKLPINETPSDDDLKQMFAYNYRFGTNHSILLYPGKGNEIYEVKGDYYNESDKSCSLLFVPVMDAAGKLINDIGEKMVEYLKVG